MRKNNKRIIRQLQVMSLLLIYLFIVLSHNFYLPRIVPSKKHHPNSIFKRKFENQPVNGLERQAKAVFKETIKLPTSNLPILFPDFFIAEPQDLDLQLKSFSLKTRSLPGGRYSYISLRVFRV